MSFGIADEKADKAMFVVYFPLLITALIVLFFIAKRERRKLTVVLVGPSGTGKTTLFYQLKDKSTHLGTVASMQENEGIVQVMSNKDKPIGSVRLIDVPGHPRLRHKLEHYLDAVGALVFLLDATDITPHRVEAAEELYEVLTHPHIAKKKINVVVACNKMDMELQAHSVEFVQRTLEKQLETMRKTRIALSSDANKSNVVLGKKDRAFTFSSLKSQVTFASISAQKGAISPIHEFLSKLI